MLFFSLIPLFLQAAHATLELPFVIVIPSYNNEEYCIANMDSALRQNYTNFRIIYIDDNSADETYHRVKTHLEEEKSKVEVKLVRNEKRQGALANFYSAIHNWVRDDEIVVQLDGDDFLMHGNVLRYLNRVYSNPKKEVWLTYGQFQEWHTKNRGWAMPMPEEIVTRNDFRKFVLVPCHLRTFYAWLFKLIRKEDLMWNGRFFSMGCDCAIMFPMIEMARDHFEFISRVLLLYNDKNPINDHKIDRALQREVDDIIRSLPKYTPLTGSPGKFFKGVQK